MQMGEALKDAQKATALAQTNICIPQHPATTVVSSRHGTCLVKATAGGVSAAHPPHAGQAAALAACKA